MSTEVSTHSFEAQVDDVLRLVINSLYSNREVFLRELLSNASDALDKLRFAAVTESGLLPTDPLRIRIETNAADSQLIIADNGIGMSKEELIKNLGTIAKSGTREFAASLEAAKKGDVQLIGQFGVGFYSAWLVADRVEVISRQAGTLTAHKWTSEAKGTFEVSETERETAGTTIILHLKSDCLEYLRTWKLEELIQKYSDYVHWPIELKMDREKAEADAPAEWRSVNRATALWQKSPSEVTQEQYDEFYKHVSHDFDTPLVTRHFKVEGTQEFAGLLFVPKKPPFDLFNPDSKHGIRLYVKRVFIMEDCTDILPKWLRFVRGVVDSEDLPLNVSREILQDSRTTHVIKKSVVKQILDGLEDMANKRPDDYALFWNAFGTVLKEGLHFEPDQANKLAPLLRFRSTKVDGWTSLSEVRSRMGAEQKSIYYAVGESEALLRKSPALESLVAQGTEVLLLTDSVDPFAITSLTEFEGVKIESANAAPSTTGETKIGDDSETKNLRDRIRLRLQDHLSEVRESHRLVNSPVCLVETEGLPPHLERLLRATQPNMPKNKRVMEINPQHQAIQFLGKLVERDDQRTDEYIDLLFDQALLSEGSPLPDPVRFVERSREMLTEMLRQAAEAS